MEKRKGYNFRLEHNRTRNKSLPKSKVRQMNSYKIDEKNLVIDQGLPRYSPGVRIPILVVRPRWYVHGSLLCYSQPIRLVSYSPYVLTVQLMLQDSYWLVCLWFKLVLVNFWPTLKYPIFLHDVYLSKTSLYVTRSVFITDLPNLALSIFLIISRFWSMVV